ncbi:MULTISPECIES: helix-turn-helix transcriptional regulator [Pseudomonas]|uniref:DNA-binding protein n=1 Tax=Pseudomonas eucalypticola TaxID=2599595 RepID=A0A7D5H703_9PSED|nr:MULTISPECIES: DNA-binding protein [Pseudomonas]QKZ05649.1 DNA-binding protein [Pseudomonas eucalypticola]
MEFTFTLKYQLSTQAGGDDDMLERLAVEGCDDAIVGLGQPGRLALAFIREACSANEAVASALAAVRRAVPGATLIEATPDLVGLTDMAEVVGMSRQGMRKLVSVHSISFPSPVHEGRASIWHLAEVLAWFQGKGGYSVSQGMLEVARVAMQVNIRKELDRISPESVALATAG